MWHRTLVHFIHYFEIVCIHAFNSIFVPFQLLNHEYAQLPAPPVNAPTNAPLKPPITIPTMAPTTENNPAFDDSFLIYWHLRE